MMTLTKSRVKDPICDTDEQDEDWEALEKECMGIVVLSRF